MEFPSLKIGELVSRIPIIQGGMGVGISLSGLASAVANEGGIGVIAIKNMGRFYRHVLIGKQFPHHTAVGFKHTGKALFDAVKMLGVEDISFNQPPGMLYLGENPF